MKAVTGILKKIFFSRLVFYLVGMLIAALLIWFLGPLLGFAGSAPLEGAIQRAFAITLIPAIMGLGATFANLRYRQAGNAIAEGMTKSPEAAAAETSAAEVTDLGKRLGEALDLLKKSKGRRWIGNGWLYQLPWYM